MPEFITEQYLRASDLDQNEDTIVTIRSFEEKGLRQDEKTVMKWILDFEEREERLALNTSNGITIRDLYGKEMNNWIRKKIGLYVDRNVMYNGKQVLGIRVRPRAY